MSMGHGFSYAEQPEATRHILEWTYQAKSPVFLRFQKAHPWRSKEIYPSQCPERTKQKVKLPQSWGNIAKVTYSLLGKLVIFT